MEISELIFGRTEEEALPSEVATAKAYDGITAALISATPGLGEAVYAVSQMRPINPIAVMSGKYSADEVMPSAILRAQQAAKLKERAQTIALLADAEQHEFARQRIANENARLALDQSKLLAQQGANGVGAMYKTFMDISKNMEPAQANAWLEGLMQGDIEDEGTLVDEASGRAYALRKLVEIGGPGGMRAAPAGFQYNKGGGLEPIPGGPHDPAVISREAAARKQPSDRETPAEAAAKEEARMRVRQKYAKKSQGRLYRVETEEGETVYLPTEEAVGQKAGGAAMKRERRLLGQTPMPKKLEDPLGMR